MQHCHVITFLIFIFRQMGRNPIQNVGCHGILKSIQENPDSAMETLDFAVSHTHFTSGRIAPNHSLIFANISTLFVSLFVGHHSEPGIWRLVHGSERNIPFAYSKSWGQNWHIQKSKSLKSITVIAVLLCQERWKESCQSPVDVFIDKWIKGWMPARISF